MKKKKKKGKNENKKKAEEEEKKKKKVDHCFLTPSQTFRNIVLLFCSDPIGTREK